MDQIAAADVFFAGRPQEWAVYEALRTQLTARWPETALRVMKSCVSFDAPRPYAYLSHPKRRADAGKVILTFGLRRRLADARVFMAAEAAPGRFTHHVLLGDASQIDEQLLAWISEAKAVKA